MYSHRAELHKRNYIQIYVYWIIKALKFAFIFFIDASASQLWWHVDKEVGKSKKKWAHMGKQQLYCVCVQVTRCTCNGA